MLEPDQKDSNHVERNYNLGILHIWIKKWNNATQNEVCYFITNPWCCKWVIVVSQRKQYYGQPSTFLRVYYNINGIVEFWIGSFWEMKM